MAQPQHRKSTSSSSFDPANELTITAPPDLEKQSTTEKNTDHSSQLEKLDTVHTIHTNVDAGSIIEPPSDAAFYESIPNGGYGWFIAVAGFLSNFVMFGAASIWGVFSNAYATSILQNKASSVELMGVGSTMIACLNLLTPLSPVLAKLGARVVMAIGSVMMSLGLILAGFSYEIWHLYLTQGVLFGCGASLVYMSIVSVVPQWFTTRRGTAMGISSAGTGFGGLALSPMASSLIAQYGLPWAYRIIGLMSFGICMISTFLMRTRLPPNFRKQPIRSPIKPEMLKDMNFVLWLLGAVIALTGYFIPLYVLPKYAASVGVSAANASTIVGVACALNAIGRLVLGWVADKIGRLNMYIIANIFAGLFCMLLWPFAKTYGALMAFAVLWGTVCGIYFALAPPITATIVGMEKTSSGLAILFVASAVSSVGPPIASAIQTATPNEGYIGVQMFAGSVYIFGSLMCIVLKIKMTKSVFAVI
ncbi:major facilitator superfamily domain-containing protein [Radiomyces spectabilis]|uniref:major facilitator superfamily domain-containing protein n=1 Tax=Radiomyces spectabilis TaxID=64574 RepID=UPI00221EB47B|nr:major facilitator superfamily domain-containing protein [Radiomyces spectabilis]KAI8379137.1 major facilitator superfamily domain-containing protein [Radiomyces spectabilis]